MASVEEHRTSGGNLGFFLKSAGYPERAPPGSVSFTMRVDGVEVLAEESAGDITLSAPLTSDEAVLPALATYAAGRMLREDAAPAWGGSSAFLWQSAPASSGATGMLRLFETFMDSLDWWRERVESLRRAGADDAARTPETMVIRP